MGTEYCCKVSLASSACLLLCSCSLLLLLPVLYGPASKSLSGEHIGLAELKLLVSSAGAKHTSFLHEVPNHRYCIGT